MKQFNQSLPAFVLLTILSLTAFGCATRGGAQYATRGSGPASDVASLLNGTYRLQEGNSDLRLDISSTSGVGSSFSLLATASGRLDGRSVSEQSTIRLETEGPDVMMTIIPRFGEPVTQLSPDAEQISQGEIQSACTLFLTPYDEGWAGRPPGTGTCARAIAGATGQWQVEILPKTIRFSDPKTQRTLVFQEVEGRQGR
ncbi:MAG TPA: hypothetical protein VF789_15120 [Thermoanaerobaculia bacterium]